jgi:hypothetical protein
MAAALAIASACDLQRSKLPESPEAPPPPGAPAEASAWADAGDAACPGVMLPASGGPPGQGARPGRLVRAGGRVACIAGGIDHGMATEPGGRGTAATGRYQRGTRTGRWIGRYAGGALAWRGDFDESGRETGTWAYYDPRGAPVATGDYREGRRVGMWLHWAAGAAPGDPAERFEVHDEGGRVTGRGVIRGGKPAATHPVCLIGRAAPLCRSILFADFSLRGEPLDGSGWPPATSWWSATIDLGGVINVTERHGVGLTAGIYLGDEYAGSALRARYRYWLTDWLASEVAAGVLFRRGDLADAEERGLSARLQLSFADLLSVGAELERYDLGDGDEICLHLNLRVGLVVILSAAYLALHVGG